MACKPVVHAAPGGDFASNNPPLYHRSTAGDFDKNNQKENVIGRQSASGGSCKSLDACDERAARQVCLCVCVVVVEP